MKRPGLLAIGPFSSNSLIVLVAVFVALFANTAFITSAFNVYKDSAEEILFASSLLLFITAIFVVILSPLCHRAAVKPVLIVFLILSSLIAYFMNQYGVIVDDDMLVNLLETDTGEARDVLSFALVLYVLILGVVPSLFIYRVELNLPRPKAALIFPA